jgi:hypothetical protein
VSGSLGITGGTVLLNSTGSTLLSGVLTGGSQATLSKQNIGALTVTDVAGLNAFGAGITLGNGSLILATDTNSRRHRCEHYFGKPWRPDYCGEGRTPRQPTGPSPWEG